MVYVQVTERFVSIQGESSYSGLPCFFIRLGGCNLHCNYCDTPHAHDPGARVSVGELAGEWAGSSAMITEITGGEPLLQEGFRDLAAALRDEGRRPVLVETNGSLPLDIVPEGVIAIVDVKTPDSGAHASFDERNLKRLRPGDEVKFVLNSERDYRWARDYIRESGLADGGHEVLFAATSHVDGPDLARWIMRDGLAVRLQVRVHQVLGLR